MSGIKKHLLLGKEQIMIRVWFGCLALCCSTTVFAEAAMTASGVAKAPVASGVASAPAAAKKEAPPSGLKPFDDIVKDASKHEGLITVWQKDSQFWLELKPEDLKQHFFFSSKIKQGIGEGEIYGGAMLDAREVGFRRIYNQVQLISFNKRFDNASNQSQSLAVAAAYSPSLIGSGAVVSQPHPKRKTILVDANAMFLPDLNGTAIELNRQYHQNYLLDGRNSAITASVTRPSSLVLEVQQHYFASMLQRTPNATPTPSTPQTLNDPRSLFLTFHYSLLPLPAEPMRPRLADQRVGHFTTQVADLTDENLHTLDHYYVNRWRLEKKDPAAELSAPVKPIVFWLDRTIPEQYRPAITAGILEWNKAFERIGFKDALQVRVQGEKDRFDTLEVGYASVRWLADTKLPFSAKGPSQVDSRSGEILDADVVIQGMSIHRMRLNAIERSYTGEAHTDNYAEFLGNQMAYAQNVWSARGEILSDSPELQQYMFDALKALTIHEIGHTLGLRHNFRSSGLFNEAQLADPVFTRQHGLAGSVMDYLPVNLPMPGKPRPEALQTQLGPYDYWAIEYAYKPLAPEVEKNELQKIAARSTEPELAYGTDEDVQQGLDPEVLMNDLGRNPLAFARTRIAIAKDLIAHQAKRTFKPGEDYAGQRQALELAFGDLQRVTEILARQIGGVKTLRDMPDSGRDPIQPLDAQIQRDALALLSKEILSAENFKLPAALLRQAPVDYLVRSAAWMHGHALAQPGTSLASRSLQIQKVVLNRIFSDAVLTQILDSSEKNLPKSRSLGLPEIWAKVEQSVWSELAQPGEIPPLRRDLQREYLNRMVNLLLKPSSLSRADARALLRAQAHNLHNRLQVALKRTGRGAETTAHLRDCQEMLQEALGAKMIQQGT